MTVLFRSAATVLRNQFSDEGVTSFLPGHDVIQERPKTIEALFVPSSMIIAHRFSDNQIKEPLKGCLVLQPGLPVPAYAYPAGPALEV